MENISWTTFGIGIALSVLIYYLVIFIYCYGHELNALVPKKPDDNSNPLFLSDREDEELSENAVETDVWQEPETENRQVDSLLEALKEGIGFASDHEYQPLAFKAHLASIIRKFPELHGSDFQPAINELIVKECRAYGVMALSEDDAVLLWNSNP